MGEIENKRTREVSSPPVELEKAVELLERHTSPILETCTVPLLEARGRVVAEDVTSASDNPPFDRSPLDGYALNHRDSNGASKEHPVRLKVIREIFAGGGFQGEVQPGQAVSIMTGAPIPQGCDCVIRQEDTDCGEVEVEVEIYRELEEHQNYCFRGEDIRHGQKLARRGDVLTYVHLGVLSSIGIEELKVLRPAKVGLMCTGDEIVRLGSSLTPGKIYDSNFYLLAGRLADLGLSVLPYPPTADDASAIAARIRDMADEADIIITTGGVSVGKKDLMHEVFDLLKVSRLFWRVNFKPGTPALCGVYKNKLLICLSGNPFAAATTFELLARPALAALTGQESLKYRRKTALLKDDFWKPSPGRRFIRARLSEGEVFLNSGRHASGMLFSMLGCNALIDIPAGSPPLKKGTVVDVVEL